MTRWHPHPELLVSKAAAGYLTRQPDTVLTKKQVSRALQIPHDVHGRVPDGLTVAQLRVLFATPPQWLLEQHRTLEAKGVATARYEVRLPAESPAAEPAEHPRREARAARSRTAPPPRSRQSQPRPKAQPKPLPHAEPPAPARPRSQAPSSQPQPQPLPEVQPEPRPEPRSQAPRPPHQIPREAPRPTRPTLIPTFREPTL
ncbi:hypothetical protein I3F58_11375 [Streptomyces sp. MUM 203J]|uniref:hypothetical protein n=1 Tax=Streptomyces sp. MUM 203J TaxID=2791990 RepID=UPI001F03514F|nr:hypothetical protein [Streptomyces sp. MUM 203J]MCH0540160.1 hypothetical protein [Streptomyces sp. MUM 203J]